MASTLRQRALRLLARREHSRAELARKLAPHAADPGELERVLQELEQRGWLSERRLIEQLVHARRARFGARRIEEELRRKGVSEEAIAEALRELRASEREAARAIWRRKFGRAPGSAAERARQVRFLLGRGFSPEIAHEVVGGGRTEGDEGDR